MVSGIPSGGSFPPSISDNLQNTVSDAKQMHDQLTEFVNNLNNLQSNLQAGSSLQQIGDFLSQMADQIKNLNSLSEKIKRGG